MFVDTQLVYVAGVAQTSTSIGDPTALFPGFLYNPLHAEFQDVNYFEVMGQVPLYWSTPAAAGMLQDFVLVPCAEADYLINFSVLKGHSSRITCCGKNLYGSPKRCPSTYLYGQGNLNYYDM